MDYFLGIAGVQQGPLSEAELRQLIVAGAAGPDDMCWAVGWSEWKTLRETFPEAFASVGPPPLPADQSQSLPPPLPKESVVVAAAAAPRSSGLASASLTLGLCGMILGFLTGIPAVICGHRARRTIALSDGRVSGGAMATTGLVFGYATSVMSLCLLGILWLWYAQGPLARERAELHDAISRENLARIARASGLYTLDHEGRFPETPEDLRDILGPLFEEVMDLPHTREREADGYAMIAGLDATAAEETILAYERKARADGSVALVRVDEVIEIVSERELAALLESIAQE